MSKISSDVYRAPRQGIALQAGALLRYALLAAADFLIGFLLTQTKVMLGFAPFGVAYVAADNRRGISRAAGVLGVAAGYFFASDNNFYYLAAAAGALALGVLGHKYLKERRLLITALSGGLPLIFFAALAAVGAQSISLSVMVFTAQAVLSGAFAVFLHMARPVLEKQKLRSGELTTGELVSVVMLLCALLLSLSGVFIYGMNLAHAAAALVVVLAAYRGGFAYGSAAAGICGLTLALGAPANISALPALLFGGLLAGFFSGGKLFTAAAMVSGGIVSTLLQGVSLTSVYVLYEISAGVILFAAAPAAFLDKLYSYVYIVRPERRSLKHAEVLKRLFVERLRQASQSFGDIAQLVEANETRPAAGDDIAGAWNAAADKVCRRCAMCTCCWGGQYNDTADVMNRLVTVYRRNGTLSRTDMPDYFSLRCLKTDELAKTLNRELDSYVDQRRRQQKGLELKRVLANQYSSIRSIMEVLAEDMEKTAGFDEYLEKQIGGLLSRMGAKKAGAVCMVDNDGMMSVSLTAYGMEQPPDAKKLEELISESARRSMRVVYSSYENGVVSAMLRDRERYSMKVARSCRKKRGEQFSGDSSSVFSPANGKYVLAISDGMGSGRAAARNSTMAVRFLERLMRAGFDRDSAFQLLNCAYLLKAEDEDFVTVDVAVINLVTGLCEFVKAGAASSFIKRGPKIYELGCRNTPVGILSDMEFEKNRCNLKTGDFLVMVSDGVCESDAERITSILEAYQGEDPEALASLLMGECALMGGTSRDDDITVAVGLVQNAS